MSDVCEVDDKPILVMAYKGLGYCSENCRKILQGDHNFNPDQS